MPPTAAPLVNYYLHSEKHVFVEGELILRASHNHSLFPEDNSQVSCHLEEVRQTISYAVSVKTSQRTNNGRYVWMDLTAQYRD